MTLDDPRPFLRAQQLLDRATSQLEHGEPTLDALALSQSAVLRCRALAEADPARRTLLARALAVRADTALLLRRSDLAAGPLTEAAALYGIDLAPGRLPLPVLDTPLPHDAIAHQVGHLLTSLADAEIWRQQSTTEHAAGEARAIDPEVLYRAALILLDPGDDPGELEAFAFTAWRLADLVEERRGPHAAVDDTRAAIKAWRAVPVDQIEGQPLAEALLDLAIRCEHDPAEAAAAADEAVALYRNEGIDPATHRFDLARGLFIASVYHGALGRRPVALSTIEQAVALLERADPDARRAARPLLAHCLHNLGLWTQPIRPRAAEPALRRAVALYRALDAEDPGTFADDVATSLASLASLLAVHRHPDEAALLNDEAVTRLRVLAEAGVEHMDGALADALIIAGSLAHARGDSATAAASWDEGIERLWPAFEAAPEEKGYTTALLLACRQRLAARDPDHRRDLTPLFDRFNDLQWPDGPGLVRQGRWTLDGPAEALARTH